MATKKPTGYREFELDLNRVITERLPLEFDKVSRALLHPQRVQSLPEDVQGVYTLFHKGKAVYVGKTDADAGFRNRLGRHFNNISHRVGLRPRDVSFKAVRVMVFTVVNVESALLRHYAGVHGAGSSLAWQNLGFGSNDPGQNREGQAPAAFDVQYPVDIDVPLPWVVPLAFTNLLELLLFVKSKLPYDFRFGTDLLPNGKFAHYRTGHIDQRQGPVSIPAPNLTMRQLIDQVMLPALPPRAWRVTLFHGRVILYPATPTPWPHTVWTKLS
ncbi:MAG: hypothetical protein RJA99_3161 [Pseudomonadota bacterium]|jgi:hypothetical protein